MANGTKYLCPECKHEVLFEETRHGRKKDSDTLELIIIKEQPGRCTNCGKYFYKRECKVEQ